MMKYALFTFLLVGFATISSPEIDPSGTSIKTRFLPPQGYERTENEDASFAAYLRNLPLKPHGAKVRHYDGSIKENYDVYDAVVDLPIGEKDLHQCADAIMRLRADYLKANNRSRDIHFNLTNGFRVDYSKWQQGHRIQVKGNRSWWYQPETTPNNDESTYLDYLELIFNYAGSYSLSKELKPVNISDIKVGDVFIYGGFPGHAVIVVDMVRHQETSEKLMLLAQSYMPAQEIQILKNPNNLSLSPWYEPKFVNDVLFTPEWTFYKGELMRF